ncbi:MAG: ABC transporter substrate-binding protein [Gammaproteobacteria bacterium]|nr:ABC transporter substrate-binding protein [Gammaproteobacteria bacterium]
MDTKKVSTTVKRCIARLLFPVVLAVGSASAYAQAPLKIGYSDWPGWVAWQVAIDKGWFKQAGVPVDFEWFDYSASMNAFTAGKIDADLMTNGDTLVTGAGGGKSIMIMLTDYSDGNDMIVARPGIRSLRDLRGKKVSVEFGLVEHLLLLNGLKKMGMTQSDVSLVNAPTNSMPQVLASGEVAAIGAWQPIAGEAMRALPGSRPIYTSADAPGLIYDVLAVNPVSARRRRADWVKVLQVWNRVVKYINNPKTRPDAVRIMAARVGISPKAFLPLLKGTKLLSLAQGKKIFVKGRGLNSLYGSSKVADDFNVANHVYKKHQNLDNYIDPSFTNEALKSAH